MKDLSQIKFCLGLHIEHLEDEIMLDQSIYIQKVLRQFNIDSCHPLSSPMVVKSLNVNKYPFHPLKEREEILGPEVPYLSAIGALLYLANNTRPDIAFIINLLTKYSATPTQHTGKELNTFRAT